MTLDLTTSGDVKNTVFDWSYFSHFVQLDKSSLTGMAPRKSTCAGALRSYFVLKLTISDQGHKIQASGSN